MKRGIIGFVVLALALVASPARADSTYGSITGVDGVLHHGCLAYPYHYTVHVPGGGEYRAINTTLVAPDGAVADTGYVVPGDNNASGTSTFVLCQEIDPYGTYTIRAEVEWAPTKDATKTSSTLDDAHFTLRKPFTTTSVRASDRHPAYGQRVRYRITTLDERPTGDAPNAFAWVHLEKRSHGHWVRMRNGRGMTHSTGRVTLRIRYLGHHTRMRIRAVTEPTVRYAASVSPTLRLW
jgi:hypothetical protein